MKNIAYVFGLAAALFCGAAFGAAYTNFNLYTSLTGNEIVVDAANATGAAFKTSTYGAYQTTTYVHNSLTTVAALPTCNAASKGFTYTVSDANGPTYAGTLSGSGSVIADAICDGTNWTAH